MTLAFHDYPDTAQKPSADDTRDDAARRALLQLLTYLEADDYRFVTPTPATHARVVARPERQAARDVYDVLGWSLPFAADLLPAALMRLLEQAGVLRSGDDGRLVATVRVSTVQGAYFLHSAFPTTNTDAVFLGPDSYRVADLILAKTRVRPRARILDYGAGAGVGGITAARQREDSVLTLADINPKALFLSSINAEFAGVDHVTVEAGTPGDVPGEFDLIVTHPPFMMDEAGRAYRDGGDLFGARLSLDWVVAGMRKLRPAGKLVLHTGVSIVDRTDVLLQALRDAIPATGWQVDYHELDPDIFGDELDQPAYAEVDRIAAVGLCLTRGGGEQPIADPTP
ncbi:MAG TPA: methyltransferase [Sphingomonas sp.]|nr:methyltransferase [Sphingomonas sp.]